MTHECDPHINYIHKLRTFNRLIFLVSALILRYEISAGYDEDELIRIRVQTLPVFACMKLIDCWSAIDISARICRNEIKWWKIQPAPRQTEFHDSYKYKTIEPSAAVKPYDIVVICSNFIINHIAENDVNHRTQSPALQLAHRKPRPKFHFILHA